MPSLCFNTEVQDVGIINQHLATHATHPAPIPGSFLSVNYSQGCLFVCRCGKRSLAHSGPNPRHLRRWHNARIASLVPPTCFFLWGFVPNPGRISGIW
jgi:hypothetical protein